MSDQLARVIGETVVTYWLHSTLLLCGAWLCVTVCRLRHPVATERLWKLAAIGALFTVPAQWLIGWPRVETRVTVAPWLRGGIDWVANSQPPDQDRDSRARALPGPASEARPTTPSAGVGSDVVVAGIKVEESDRAADSSFANRPRAQPTPEPPGVLRDRDIGSDATGQPDSTVRLSSSSATRRPAPYSWIVLLACGLVIWAGGQALRVVSQGVAWHWRFRRSLHAANSTTIGILDDLRSGAGVNRRVDVACSELAGEPVACGLWRWRILLPAEIEKVLAPAELKALLAHELAHLVRGDVAWLWVGRFLCSCLAFQPLNFLARRRWQRAAEPLCDDWAVREGVVAPLDLARCLATIAEWRLGRGPERPAMAQLGLAARGQVPIVERVERLLGDGKHLELANRPALRRLAAAAAIGLWVLTTWTGPRFVLGGAAMPRVRPAEAPAEPRLPEGRGDRPALLATATESSPFELQSAQGPVDASPAAFEVGWQELDGELALLDRELSALRELAKGYEAGPADLGSLRVAELLRLLEARRQGLAERRNRVTASLSGDIARTTE